ncbi:serine/threonine protein kinase [Planktothrix agardhii 1032]|uniref:serine/threonine protein kinase n=1 Tax=Planktothrix agardhii TaxID=1160 RepID=UPI001D0AD4CB|nr:serine/threonine-protein kinase [Planktothrix agardhii]MCB8780217.1 serine/threonine protein kinase [Planktothrix agardhii 1031]MCF3600802.1 serine/threonine protein kinase [Planktothrix agardhii 1032]
MSPELITLATESLGQKIEGKYHLKQFLGAGSYSVVFLANEVDQEKDCLIRKVAVKLMSAVDNVNNMQELKISRDLQHPHVLQYFTSGQYTLEQKLNLGDGQHQPESSQYLYLVMELAEESLEKYFNKHKPTLLDLLEAETWKLVESLVSALVYFSELSPKKLVHRDLKPANVLRVGDRWKISDFGIVRQVENDILTTMNPLATPAYAPPEFYDGTVSLTFDVWSLGVMIVEMLTGQLPFVATSDKSLQIVVMEDPPQIVSPLPSLFAEIVEGCLEKKHENRLTAEQLEVNFIIPRLVREEWKPDINSETQKAQTEEAVKIVKMSRPKLKKKTQNPNILLRYILKLTKFQHPLLTQLLQWVCDAKSIPVEGEEQWIDQLVRVHIKDWNAQKLAEYLDLNAPSNSFWLGLQNKYDDPFVLVDEFLAMPKKIIDNQEKIHKINKILVSYKSLIYNKVGLNSGETNFHSLILNSLNHKFLEAQKIMAQDQLNQLLTDVVNGATGDLEAIIIFDLETNCPRFSNSQLKKSNPELDHALFGDEDDEAIEAIEGFNALSTIQEALNQIGEKTKFGNLKYSIFKLDSGTIIVDVVELGIPLAICFLAPKKIKLGNVVGQYGKKIAEIKEALRTM